MGSFRNTFMSAGFLVLMFLMTSVEAGVSAGTTQGRFPAASIMVELAGDGTAALSGAKMDIQLKGLVKKYGAPQIAQSFPFGQDQKAVDSYINGFLEMQGVDALLASLGLARPAIPPLHRVYTFTFTTAKSFDRDGAITALKSSKNFVSVTEDWVSRFKDNQDTTLSWLKPYLTRYVGTSYQILLSYLDYTHQESVTKFLASLETWQAADYNVATTTTTSGASDAICTYAPLSEASLQAKNYVPDMLLVTLRDDETNVLTSGEAHDVLTRYQASYTQRYARLGTTYQEVQAHHAAVLQKYSKRSLRRMAGVAVPAMNRLFRLNFPAGTDLNAAMADLCATNKFKSVKPNRRSKLLSVPNDPYYSSSGTWGQSYDDMWGLKIIGSETAWDITTGDPELIVAVIDSGLDETHSELTDNVYVNPGETDNGVDDDGNGYVDDINGYNFNMSSGNINDGVGHGTHVAGTIAAQGNNGSGITGVMWDAQLMSLRVFNNSGAGGDDESLQDALVYATDMGAAVVNMSLGRYLDDREEENPFGEQTAYAYSQGVVMVASSGNDDADCSTHYPSADENVIAVGSSTTSDGRSSFSNYCDELDMVAPGGDNRGTDAVNILSLRAAETDIYAGTAYEGEFIVDDNYFRMSGTSMATPHVTGAVGLILSAYPSLDVEEVSSILRETADDIEDSGIDDETGYGRLNVGAALTAVNARCSAQITGPTDAVDENGASVTTQGYAGGDDFGSYEIALYAGADSSGTLVDSSTSTAAVSDGTTLATFNAASLGMADGGYAVYLTVYNADGNVCGRDHQVFTYAYEEEESTDKAATLSCGCDFNPDAEAAYSYHSILIMVAIAVITARILA